VMDELLGMPEYTRLLDSRGRVQEGHRQLGAGLGGEGRDG